MSTECLSFRKETRSIYRILTLSVNLSQYLLICQINQYSQKQNKYSQQFKLAFAANLILERLVIRAFGF